VSEEIKSLFEYDGETFSLKAGRDRRNNWKMGKNPKRMFKNCSRKMLEAI
jgi:hypothetical protein